MGKGQAVAFDAWLEKELEKMRAERGFYPMLKEIGAECSPPRTVDFIYRSLRRLADGGRLSKDAMQVYNSKNKKGDSTNAKSKTSRSKAKAKR